MNAGTLIVAAAGALPDGTSLTVIAGGTLIFDPMRVNGSPFSFDAGPGIMTVPEPGTLALLAAGLVVGFGVWRRRKYGT